MIVYALGAGITAAAGTRLALQLILITVFGLHPFQVPPTESRQDCCGSSLPHRGVCIGQFARLLPTLVVVAVSQAPSPESNPDSPLLVRAIVVHYTTITADKSEVRAIKRCYCGSKPPLCQHICPRGTSLSQPTARCLCQALVFIPAGCYPPYRVRATAVEGSRWSRYCYGRPLHSCISLKVLEDVQLGTFGRWCQPHAIA